MSLSFDLQKVDIIILCGGLGKRLRSVVQNQPKGLVAIAGKPILEILVDDLLNYGAQKIIFCVGHLKEQIIEHFSGRNDCEFLFSKEDSPLGTGGAIKKAKTLVKSSHLMILNGDSMCQVNYEKFYEFHLQSQSLLSMILALPVEDSQDYGNVQIDVDHKICSFQEKKQPKERCGFMNAGIYLMKKEGFAKMPKRQSFSLEYDFFPKILQTDRCSGFVVKQNVYDIGTPERLQHIHKKMNFSGNSSMDDLCRKKN